MKTLLAIFGLVISLSVLAEDDCMPGSRATSSNARSCVFGSVTVKIQDGRPIFATCRTMTSVGPEERRGYALGIRSELLSDVLKKNRESKVVKEALVAIGETYEAIEKFLKENSKSDVQVYSDEKKGEAALLALANLYNKEQGFCSALKTFEATEKERARREAEANLPLRTLDAKTLSDVIAHNRSNMQDFMAQCERGRFVADSAKGIEIEFEDGGTQKVFPTDLAPIAGRAQTFKFSYLGGPNLEERVLRVKADGKFIYTGKDNKEYPVKKISEVRSSTVNWNLPLAWGSKPSECYSFKPKPPVVSPNHGVTSGAVQH